jgi:hypothetical protein
MTQTFWLRAAAVVALLFAAGHMLGAANSWSPLGETAVLQSMRSFEFDVMGSRRTYAKFYVGFGVYIGVLLVAKGVLLWQLSALARRQPASARPLVVTLALASTVGAVVCAWYIFILPALFAGALAGCIGAALVVRPRAPSLSEAHELR